MTEQELMDLIAQGESQNLEFKDERFKPSSLAETFVAFANTNPGKVIIGIDEKSRRVSGIKKKEEVINNIHRAANPSCVEPTVNISIEEVSFRSLLVFVITVPYQPVSLFTTSGRALLRRGAENVPATTGEIINLSGKRGQLRYEASLVDGATLEDLDFDLLTAYRLAYREKRGRNLTQPDVEILKTIGAIRKEEEEYKPTVAGMLIFGKQPQKFLPQSEVAVVRYPGEEVTRNLRDSREFSGTIPQMIERILEYISEHIQVASIRGELHQRGRREDIPDYSLPALREIIINAIAHREYQIRGSRVIVKWFTDHIQVWSPGGFVEPITPETIYAAGPFHRNPDLMKALYGYGYVEAYGDGMHLIKEQFEKHPLKPPLPGFREAPGGVFTTVYAADLSKVLNHEKKENGAEEGLNERQIQALAYLRNNSSLSKRKFMELNRVSDKTAYLELSDLVRREILIREGKGRAVVYRMKAGIE